MLGRSAISMSSKAARTKTSREEMLKRFESPDYDGSKNAELVRGRQDNATQPLSFRASEPLVAALDRLAARDHRTRANLIQHILWDYVNRNR